MFCSSCGVSLEHDLSFCKHCGAKLVDTRGNEIVRVSGPPPDQVLWAMVSVFVVGLGVIIALLAMSKQLGLDPGDQAMVKVFMMLTFFMMFAIECAFFWLLFRPRRVVTESDATQMTGRKRTKELEDRQVRTLPPSPASVT